MGESGNVLGIISIYDNIQNYGESSVLPQLLTVIFK